MNVNKKFDRLRQWGKERLGGDVTTNASDDFKSLETEMTLRHEGISDVFAFKQLLIFSGMERLHSSMNIYVRYLLKRSEGDGREKSTPGAYLGWTMNKHGEDFEPGSNFGECLMQFGQANERIARMQDSYAENAMTSWLDACERSLAQMKEYQNARKKLESRRLAYDASLAKTQKTKKEDFRVEEDLRSQKAKFEESQDDIMRRMNDIIDAEKDNVAAMYIFLEAQLNYHDRCREALLNLKNNWPVASVPNHNVPHPLLGPRSRANTLNRFPTASSLDTDLEAPNLPFRSSRASSNASSSSPRHELPGFDLHLPPATKPPINRSITSETLPRPQTSRAPTDTSTVMRPQLLTVRDRDKQRPGQCADVFGDLGEDKSSSSSDRTVFDDERSASPTNSYVSHVTLNSSWSTLDGHGKSTRRAKKAPPPPPPSRSTKPPPPPPPMKRSALSTSSVPYAT